MTSDVGVLRSLSRTEPSGVSILLDYEMTLSLDKSFINSIDDGITEVLSSKMMKFDPREKVNRFCVLSGCPEDLDVPSFQVSLQSNFYVFAPRPGDHLDVVVLTVGTHSATARALGRFKVFIRDLTRDSLAAGQSETIRIVSVAYVDGLPELIGVCLGDREDFQQENFIDVGNIAKSEEEMEVKKLKKIDKTNKLKKMTKTKKSGKKLKKMTKSDKGKKKTVQTKRIQPEAPGEEDREEPRAKKPRNSFELPAGFTVINRATKSKSWKEYKGPDGRKYRSLVAIQRELAGGIGSDYENHLETIVKIEEEREEMDV